MFGMKMQITLRTSDCYKTWHVDVFGLELATITHLPPSLSRYIHAYMQIYIYYIYLKWIIFNYMNMIIIIPANTNMIIHGYHMPIETTHKYMHISTNKFVYLCYICIHALMSVSFL